MERKKSAVHRRHAPRKRKKERAMQKKGAPCNHHHRSKKKNAKPCNQHHGTKKRAPGKKKGAMHITSARPQRHSAMQNRQKLEKKSSSRVKPVTSGD